MNRTSIVAAVLLLAIVSATTTVRTRLLSMPLERDEGEYAYAGLLILKGQRPYERLYNMKWPGTYYGYALIEALFGRDIEGIRIGILLVNVAAILLVFLIVRRLLDAFAAVAAALAYAVLSLSPATLGLAGHATHFVVLCVLAAILVLQHACETRRLGLYLLAGIFAGAAPIMKQPGIVFTIFILAAYAFHEFRRSDGWPSALRRGTVLLGGAAIPFVIMLASVWANHSFDTFWLWTITYARHYGRADSLAAALDNFLHGFFPGMGAVLLFWLLGGAGILLLPLHPRTCARAPFLLGLLAASCLGVCPGLMFRPHYFILLLPALSFLCGAAVFVVRRRLGRRSPWIGSAWAIGMVFVPLTVALGVEREFFFWETPTAVCRSIYGPGCPFVESVPVADYIREHTAGDDCIAVLGSEPQIYFYCRRPAATGHIYTYAMMERHPYAHTFQEQMIREIEAAHPKYVVHVKMNFSWLERPDSDKTLLRWFDQYSKQNLRVVGIVERDRIHGTRLRWDEPNMHEHKGVRTLITVYRRDLPP
jgi:hypothetical protein